MINTYEINPSEIDPGGSGDKGTGLTPWLHQVIDVLSEKLPHSVVVEFPGGYALHIWPQQKDSLQSWNDLLRIIKRVYSA